ncbi:STN and carboxypeptidase regulatory-like domain-containing protein [Dyadobacter sp. CY356]|uniref:STN and carboxypeptidase regulatory-like domain-containing protein n=1 Tax=Dyadobacter sp. CY356 TaxID=2906442 RepID=UPI001F3DA131|nr:STN and carboxypeptidase regulatory-like domain-containing protein [Dyadobacter sp. CY356]MCF0054421.1 carboxypeptidase-like regulatory domain-containing protein [Dyadobacter sp. CY356]
MSMITALSFMLSVCYAQSLLNKSVSVSVKNKQVSEVLKIIGAQGNFSFSYNSDIIPGDSIISISVHSKSVKQVLDVILRGNYQFKEAGDFLIIQKSAKEKFYHISGQIFDSESGKTVDFASVYSRQLLTSALTDNDGVFKLRMRDKNFPILLTVSKVGYADTTIIVNSDISSSVNITLNPKAIDLDTLIVKYSEGGNSWLVRRFVSSRLRLQSRNISRFFVALPYQISLTPGLSSHGKMSSQIVNKLSINIYGGYTAGVNGVEIGGLFNISKKDVRYLQMASTFNAVSGHVTGVQIGGVYNQVLDSLVGVQMSGFAGWTKGNLKGVQMAGLYNKVSGNIKGIQVSGGGNVTKGTINGGQISGIFNKSMQAMHGFQISGGVNIANEKVSGPQISGIGNISKKETNGLQLSSMFNYAKNLKGVQIGVVNLADSSSGYSFGLLNIVKNGKRTVSVYGNEMLPLNIAWKSGSKKLYNILTVGTSVGGSKAFTFGFGIGREFKINKNLTLHAEIIDHNIYLGTWKDLPVLYRFQSGLNIKLSKSLSLSAGPAFSMFYSEQKEFKNNYQSFSDKGFMRFKMSQNGYAWLGWQGGLSWNYGSIF